MFYLISLCSTTLLILFLFILIRNNDKGKLTPIKKTFFTTLLCLLIWCLGLIFQLLFAEKYNIKPIYFDYFVYIGACFLPVTVFLMSVFFIKNTLNNSKKYLLLFIIPILSLLVLWTSDFHQLFYITYATDFNHTHYGMYFYIYSVYTYGLLFVSFYLLLKHSIKQSGFFSMQAMLITLSGLIPIITNLLGILQIVNMTIYITPITFTFTVGILALSIFKFGFLKITPIALKQIVDRISDSYIVLNGDLIVVDYNKTFVETFNITSTTFMNKDFASVVDLSDDFKKISDKILKAIESTQNNSTTVVLDEYFSNIDKYFHIEINSIINGTKYLGTLILFKDITQHKQDMQTIQDNQDILIEKERLASLGQMIGGIAHNLKTPIMSIAGAAEGLSDLINEYRNSIGDAEVTVEDHHEIASDMDEWISKIRTHLSYMSDIITAVKGQAVAFSDNMINGFTVEELVKHVDILMKHELKNALINMNTTVELDKDTQVNGNINSLVQVINNIISNAIQAYNGKENQTINFTLSEKENNLIINIQDFAGGLPEKVQEKLFKEMITTKGKNGTGLGLFMSYSNIKAHFNGHMKYETKQGEGTTFVLEIPLTNSKS